MATKPTAELQRLSQVNGEFYDALANPLGLGNGGHRQVFPPALHDFAVVGNFVAQTADEVEQTAGSVYQALQDTQHFAGVAQSAAQAAQVYDPAPFQAHVQSQADPHQSAAQVRGGISGALDTLQKLYTWVMDSYIKQSNPLDATGGRLLTVGAFGLGAASPPLTENADVLFRSGVYQTGPSWVGAPFTSPSGDNYGTLLVLSFPGNYLTQFFCPANSGPVKVRQIVNNSGMAWRNLWDNGNFDPASKVDRSQYDSDVIGVNNSISSVQANASSRVSRSTDQEPITGRKFFKSLIDYGMGESQWEYAPVRIDSYSGDTPATIAFHTGTSAGHLGINGSEGVLRWNGSLVYTQATLGNPWPAIDEKFNNTRLTGGGRTFASGLPSGAVMTGYFINYYNGQIQSSPQADYKFLQSFSPSRGWVGAYNEG